MPTCAALGERGHGTASIDTTKGHVLPSEGTACANSFLKIILFNYG